MSGALPPADNASTVEAGADAPVARRARAAAALRAFWLTVRPTTRRGAVLGAAKVGALAAVFAVTAWVGLGVAGITYDEYGFHPDADARAWAARSLSYGTAPLCQSCHGVEYAKETTARHAGIGCESCHGPLLAHAEAEAISPEAVAAIAVPTDALCVTCHTQAVGRPATFRQIVPADHYVTACLACHDPHTGIAKRPPVVGHPLANLPACVTCHGPEGFKARNQRHPTVGTDDAYCLSCHEAGRGPATSGEEAAR